MGQYFIPSISPIVDVSIADFNKEYDNIEICLWYLFGCTIEVRDFKVTFTILTTRTKTSTKKPSVGARARGLPMLNISFAARYRELEVRTFINLLAITKL